MGYQPLEKLLPQANYSIYKLVCMAAKRAKELADGSPKLIDISSSAKTATVALEEIYAQKVFLADSAVAEQVLGAQKRKNLKPGKKNKDEQEEKIEQEQNV